MKAAKLFNIVLNLGGIVFSIIGIICIAKFAFVRQWQVNQLESEVVANLGKVEELQPVSGKSIETEIDRQVNVKKDIKAAMAELKAEEISKTEATSIANSHGSLSPRPFTVQQTQSKLPSKSQKEELQDIETEQKLLSKAEQQIEPSQSRVVNVGFNRIDPTFGKEIATGYLKHLGFTNLRYQKSGSNNRVISKGNFGETSLAVTVEWDTDQPNKNAKLKKVATQSISVVVHPDNPVNHLSVKQLAEIISGRVTQWKTIGGESNAIDLVAAGKNDSNLVDLLKTNILRKKNYSLKEDKFTFTKIDAAIKNTSTGQGVIAFIPTELVNHDQVKTLAISADENTRRVLPNQVTINALDYPLAKHQYLELPDPINKFNQGLIEFVNSEKGQKIGNNLGYTMLGTELTKSKLDLYQKHIQSLLDDKRILPAYHKIIAESDRLNTQNNLDFNYGEMDLTDESKNDLDDLASWLIREQVSSQVVLLGFADSVGRYSDNKVLSQKRAQVAADYLKGRGFENTQAIGFGEEMPIGDNSIPEGRSRNRRVEIWLVRDLPKPE